MKYFNQYLYLLAFLFVGAGCSSVAQEEAKDDFIEGLIQKMSIEEKVGQMTQITLEFVSKGEGYKVASPYALDEAKLKKAIVDYHVGSVLNNAGEARSVEKWHEIISKIQGYAMDKENAIPVIYGIDAIHGTNYTLGSTLYPQEVGLAATWNTDLVEAAAAMTAYETRASNIPWTFSPDLDLGIDARWARIWEGFGEDPYLVAQMGVAMTKGFEGDDISSSDRVASCLKHYVGYGSPRSGKDRTPAWIPERMMRELFLPPFQKAVDAGARSIMVNSGEVNGVPVHASKWLLTDVLRGEMGFEGLILTDWYDIWNLVERHHIAATRREAVKMAIDAGIDMSMVPMDLEFSDLLIDLVKKGEISEKRINESVRRILKLKKELGLFDKPIWDYKEYKKFGGEEHQAIAKEAALEAITLLKNEGVLPLKKGAKILLTGPNANSMRSLNGGWSYTWQGERTNEFAKDELTIYEALQQVAGKQNVKYIAGVEYEEKKKYYHDKATGIEKAVKAAKNVDVIVLCIGENTYTEKPGDLVDLSLSENQMALGKALLKTGKPVVLVLNEGRPRIVNDLVGASNAVVHTFLPGNKGGIALAELLAGKANFSGKMPYTYPRYVNDLMPYYIKFSENAAHNDGNDYKDPFFNPQWHFGYGLSYTLYEYKNLKLSKSELTSSENLEVSIEVVNTGEMDGKEVVQLYTTDLYASVTPSVKRLRSFKKIMLKAGETQIVTFSIPMKELAFIGIDQKWTLEPGEFRVMIGGQKATFKMKGDKKVF